MSNPLSALQSGLKILKDEGPARMAREGVFFAYEEAFRTMHKLNGKADEGTNIYEEDWDVLVVLDACRVDLMNTVSDDYDFIGDIETFDSLGSYSYEWMVNNFTDEYSNEKADTVHITGNPYADEAFDPDEFYTLDNVWMYASDEEKGIVRPRPMTDRAVKTWRNSSAGRMIVHYMQPHVPFLTRDYQDPLTPEEWGNENTSRNVWKLIRDGEIDVGQGWNGYVENLEMVLDDVEILLDSIDADDVVITADHGNCIGEHALWGHPGGINVSQLRTVPWVKTSANDTGEYEPDDWLPEDADVDNLDVDDSEVKERLRDLGYSE